jgi:multicomponent Na+:H+ antiporter subunit A
MLFALLASHFVVAALVPAAVRRVGPRAGWLAVAPFAASGAWLAATAPRVLDGEPVRASLAWVPSLGVRLDLSLDATALLMALVVAFAGTAILAYTNGYAADPSRLAGRMAAFGGAMFGLVVSDNLFGLFVFWELTTVTSYALIAYDDRSPEARRAGLQALLVTAAGGLAMLAGFVLLGSEAGTYRISEIVASPPGGSATAAAFGLILAGVLTKSAQFPFHGWLPAAMAAPTPASAFLHSATMVKAGIFLVLRLAPAGDGVAVWEGTLVAAGLGTMLLGGWTALRETDLKRILAYGTVAQLGLLTVLAARGATLAAAAALLLAHAAFKAALFMVVGIVDRSTGSRDVRVLHGLRGALPVTFAVAAAAGASMAGIPGTLGFVAKEAALDRLLAVDPLSLWLVAAGSALTAAYTLRVLRVFTGPHFPGPAHPARRAMLVPAAVLGATGVVLGLATAPVAAITDAVAAVSGAEAVKLPVWPGLKPALGVSALTIGFGVLVAALRIPARGDRHPAEAGFDAAMAGLLATARRVTATLQNGSLPVYLVVILATAVLAPGAALVSGFALPAGLVAGESWLQILLAATAALAAAGLVAVRSRLGAVLMLGVVGYGMAGLFALQGAPDLALTQVLVETVMLVIFAIVLARLPERFTPSRRPAVGPAVRAVVALAVGAFVTAGAFAAMAARTAEPVSGAYLERSLPEGAGRNVVNVILTDFRALDTFGEIAVVATAAVGIAGLVAGLRSDRRKA